MVGVVIGSLLIIGLIFLNDKIEEKFGTRRSIFVKIIVGLLAGGLIIFFLGKRYGML